MSLPWVAGTVRARLLLRHRLGRDRALEAAARHAAAACALRQVRTELRATIRRLRAVERRWIPEYETALAALELSLDEAEREQGARVRWVVRRRGTA
jgi:V/A-type H+-transporting ATPase subunit D